MSRLPKTLFAAAFTAIVPAGALAAAPMPSAYQIHPGDQLSVQVYGEQTLSQNVTVLGDGTIDYPLIGRVAIAGKTPTSAGQDIRDKLRKYLRDPIVTIAVVTMAQPTVLVLGNVKNPGKYQVRADAKLSDALAAAGGLGTTDGPLPDARIAWANGTVSQVSMQKLLHDGDVSADVPLSEGAVVYIPGPQTMNVEVIGAVDHPGEIQVNDGDRLSTAIAKAGNSANSNADLNSIRVVRQLPGGGSTVYNVNLYKALEQSQPQADLKLQKGDVVYVPQAKKGLNTTTGSGMLYFLTQLGRLFIP